MDETAHLLSNGEADALDREMESEEDVTQGSYMCLCDVNIRCVQHWLILM
jgi:hypothetical protein